MDESWEKVERSPLKTEADKMVSNGWMNDYDEPNQNSHRYFRIRQRECDKCLSEACGILKGDYSILIHSTEYQKLESCLSNCGECSIEHERMESHNKTEKEPEGIESDFMRKELYETANFVKNKLPGGKDWEYNYGDMNKLVE